MSAADGSTDSSIDRIATFDALYAASDDPWLTARRWYEERRRNLIAAALPQRRYRRAYEAGCGNGNLSEVLTTRCDELLATDGSDTAVRIARQRLSTHRTVHVAVHHLPGDWPDACFDLIVLSELLYFLTDEEVEVVAQRARLSAGAEGLVVACNWRADIAGYGHSGDDAHRLFDKTLDLPCVVAYQDDDFVLSGWSVDTRSVAMRDGLR